VDVLPAKTCNLNCVYCECGRNGDYTCERGQFIPTRSIEAELEEVLGSGKIVFDVLTFTASGEPTLHSGLGELLKFAKRRTDRPIAVLTNSTLLADSRVRNELCHADILLPSLDSVVHESFRRTNRPAPCVDLEKIIEGLTALRREFDGQIWLEVLFVKDINHGPEDIMRLKHVLRSVNPEKIQLNTVVRPPAEVWARPLSIRKMEDLREALGESAEVIVDFRRHLEEGFQPLLESEILDMLCRRPLSNEDLKSLLGLGVGTVEEALERMQSSGLIRVQYFNGTPFYLPTDGALSWSHP
jgi:wyosine [tRNA(Phe)-imidazoG37] synthetase (radical SAM superfamily)